MNSIGVNTQLRWYVSGYKELMHWGIVAIVVMASTAPSGAQSIPIAAGGQAQAVIVLGQGAGRAGKFGATELQKYLRDLTGADIPIVGDADAPAGSSQQSWILIGGPLQNRITKQAVDAGLKGFSDLKPDGFVLKTYHLGQRPIVVAGGNDHAGSMYAAFELVERLGVTFRLTGDILPARQPSLQILALDLRKEPALARRGFLLELSHHPSLTILSYQDYTELLDQMAKMKFNYLEIWWFPYQPWLRYSYHGEEKLIGDISNVNSAFVNSMYDGYGSRTTDDVSIGKHWFPNRRLVPTEFQNVETPDQAFSAAQDLLRRVIQYALMRHIKVWLVDEMAALPPNLGRLCEQIGDKPFAGASGADVHPLDPTNREIQLVRLKALTGTYPEAEGILLNFPELYFPQNNDKHHDFYAQQESAFAEIESLRKPWIDWQHVGGQGMTDSNIGYLDLFKYLLSKRDEVAPKAKLGLMTVGRGYVMPLFDKMLPQDIPFSDFDSGARAGWTPGGMPMNYFGGMNHRQRIVTPYIDDDGDILGLQFNVGVYTRVDRIFSDGVKYGLTGVAPWMSRPRGTEVNSTFMSQAAWEPELTMADFYKRYCDRLFGVAAPEMYKAFMALEDNQAHWVTPNLRPPATTIGCCGPGRELGMVYNYSLQKNPFDGPTDPAWAADATNAPAAIKMFEGSIAILDQALVSLRAAEPKVAPQGKHEVDYLINRTEAYEDEARAEIREKQAVAAFYEVFQKKSEVSHDEFIASLETSMRLFEAAQQEAVVAATKYAEIIDFPSDLEDLYRLNAQKVEGFDLITRWIRQVVNFNEGKPYWEHVPFERLFTGSIQVARQSLGTMR